MTMAVILPADEEHALRRWVFAAATVAAVHVAIVFWLTFVRDTGSAGATPAVIMIELAPLDVAPPAESPPEVTPGPQMTQPEQAKPPHTMVVPGLPPARRPAVVLMTTPKQRPKPKTIVKETPKLVAKRTREPPAQRTSVPKHSEAARDRTAAALRQGSAGSAAFIASWRIQVYQHLLRYKPVGAEGTGTVSVSFTLARSGRLLASGFVGSSGSSALDNKALEMVRRANPFPAAPSEVGGGSFPFTVPIRFR